MSDQPKPGSSFLGFSTEELAGLSSDELTNNGVAIKMLLHYYRQMVDENGALKNYNNTLKTYVDAYEKQKNNSFVAAVLLAVSNISIGFGVNLLTGDTVWPGVASLAAGLAMAGAGLIITFKR
ncbi:hypothetical protein [Pseudomonas viridiflava]|uniref:hypothetical protein n=1 Tax=Pseudomonas viridiflava TaxID=33069 RepID=UPI000F4B8F24|nr:hypothetical protein [Pseudomonas viridiflava]